MNVSEQEAQIYILGFKVIINETLTRLMGYWSKISLYKRFINN